MGQGAEDQLENPGTPAKYAVRVGGGLNYRFGLHDGFLIKDNHIAAVGSLAEAVRRARQVAGPVAKVAVEVESEGELEQALQAGADHILLDNVSLDFLRAAVARCEGRATTEASGGVSLATVRAVAETGVDFISVGKLTHSAPAVDIGLDAG